MFMQWSLGRMAFGEPASTLDFAREEKHEITGGAESQEAPVPRSGIAIPLKVENAVRGCITVLQPAESGTNLFELVPVIRGLGEMLAGEHGGRP
jgi:hypothetical protein